jgi:hypothetical protein
MIHLPDSRLDRLVVRADLGGSSGTRALWFQGCVLRGNILFVPDDEVAGFITRCFGEKLQAVLTDIEIRVGVVEQEPKAKPKPSSLWKKGREPVQGDCL